MDGLEDKLNAILSDPDAMGRISEMAKELMGSSREEKRSDGEEPLLKRAAALMRGGALRSEETALLDALRPFLSDERRARLDRAIKIARLASLARMAASLAELGGDGDV